MSPLWVLRRAVEGGGYTPQTMFTQLCQFPGDGYLAQLYCPEGVLFHSPESLQYRNGHNLFRDFEQEVPSYLNNNRIICIPAGS
jgi:hypothetical protein